MQGGVCSIVNLYAMECGSLAANFDSLIRRVAGERALKTQIYGNTPAGRRCLAAGLLLNAVLGEDCATMQNAFGKPELPGGMQFNLSHAGDYAVLATCSGSVGVDVERMRPIDSMRIAKRFFHPDEYAYLSSLPDPHAAFFSIWTLKESYVKALGFGFSVPPMTYSLLPDGASNAVFSGKTSFHFHRYDGVFPGYCLSVCALEADFPGGVTMLRPANT